MSDRLPTTKIPGTQNNGYIKRSHIPSHCGYAVSHVTSDVNIGTSSSGLRLLVLAKPKILIPERLRILSLKNNPVRPVPKVFWVQNCGFQTVSSPRKNTASEDHLRFFPGGMNYVVQYHLVMTNIAGWKIHYKWRFAAGKIIYFYGSSISWLC